MLSVQSLTLHQQALATAHEEHYLNCANGVLKPVAARVQPWAANGAVLMTSLLLRTA